MTVDVVAVDGTKVKASALEAEVSAWWRQADLLDGQAGCEPAAADAACDVPAAAGTASGRRTGWGTWHGLGRRADVA